MSNTIVSTVRDGIVTLTLNRPRKLNAINYELADALLAELDCIEVNDDARVVILTGGGDAFSAGADIHEFSESVALGANFALRDFVRRGQTMTSRLEAFSKPIIAAVNGIAYGGGCEIVEAVHLAVASETATFAKPEIALGMPPTFGGTQRLPRLAGRKRALEHLLTGEPFGPERALEIGLVNTVVPPADLMHAARELAGKIMRHSPLAAGSIITAVTRGLAGSVLEGLLVEAEAFGRVVPTRELREGLNAWRARRVAADADA